MIKTKSGIYQSPLFDFPRLIHGFSTKTSGDMRDKTNRNAFLTALGISEESLVWQEQVHKDIIHIVSGGDRGTTMPGVDGLVYKKIVNNFPVVLSVHTADCVPLLCVDPTLNVIAVAHAGWKGTTLHIGKKLITEMEKFSSRASDIRIVIGPCIGVCCYTVNPEREHVFQNEFHQFPEVLVRKNGKTCVDIGKANYFDLVAYGIRPECIDFDPSFCTLCKSNEFYSFRRSGLPLEGEILGVIGFR